MLTFKHQVTMTLIVNPNPATKHLLKLQLNNKKLWNKSDDLLDAEMTRSQSLAEDIKNLHAKYKELENRHDALTTTHEKLSYDYLQRKQELEKLRAAHEDLQKENESLRTQ